MLEEFVYSSEILCLVIFESCCFLKVDNLVQFLLRHIQSEYHFVLSKDYFVQLKVK